jgi:type IV secretory pathway TrbD component
MKNPRESDIGEGTPLLLKKDQNQLDRDNFKELFLTGLCVLSLVANLLAPLLVSLPVVWIAAALGLVMCPLAYRQQQALQKVDPAVSLSDLELQVVDMTGENQQLTDSVQHLKASLANIKVMEDVVETMGEEHVQDKTISQLNEQLTAFKDVLLQENVPIVLPKLVSRLLSSDLLSDGEINDLLRHFDHVNENLFRQTIIDEGRGELAIMKVLQHLLLYDDIEENMFPRLYEA